MRAILCYVTCGDRDEAITIGRTLVEERLAAAANVLGDTVSIYRWDDALHEKPETALVLKTRADSAERLVARICELHSYACPSVVVLPVTGGNPGYLEWVEAETEA